MHVMFALKIILNASLLTLISATENLAFLNELLSYQTFRSVKFKAILCPNLVSENIDLIKMFSKTFQKYVTTHRMDDTLRPKLEEPQTFILNTQCPQSKRVLQQAEDLGLFGKPFQWLLLSRGDSFDNTHGVQNQTQSEQNWWAFLETLSILPDSDVKVLRRVSNQKTTLTGVYKVQSILLKEPLAEWTSEKGLTVFNRKPIAIRRWNLRGLALPSTMIITHPDSLNHFDDFADIYFDRVSKINYNLIKVYEDLFNISVSFKIDTDWGRLINGSWTGMTGDFEKKEIEIGGSPLFIKEERLNIIEYYERMSISGMSFLFLSPPLSSSKNIFIMPFDTTVWYCCLTLMVTSCLLLLTAIKYEKFHHETDKGNAAQQNSEISFIEILTVNIGAICMQGTVTQTNNPPGRILTLFVYFSYMFLYISYSGSIVAILQSSDTSIRTLSDFLNSPLKAGVEDVAYNRYYFENAEDEVRKSIYTKKVAPKGETPHFLTLEEGMKKVRKGNYGFHTEVSAGYEMIQKTFTEEEKCNVQALEEAFLQFSQIWLVIKKRSPYSEHIKIGVKKCAETGIKHRIETRLNTKKPVCSSKSSRFVSVGIIDCFYAFMFLIYGWVIALLIFILEIGLFKFTKINKRRKAKTKFPSQNVNLK